MSKLWLRSVRRFASLLPMEERGRDDSDEPLFLRYFLKSGKKKNWGVFIHNYLRSDPEGVHCHPWYNISLVLCGGYIEHFHDGTSKFRKPGSIIFRTARELHRLETVEGIECWSLFIHGPNRRQWGFIRLPYEWYPFKAKKDK